MSEPNKTRTIPLHIADQAVAACEAEIQTLKEENARLKAEVERLTNLQSGADYFKAEVERLRKAGDAMLAEWENTQAGHWAIDDAKPMWNAAKEGKQS